MSDLNAVYLQGRLTKDASVNYLSNNSCVVTLSLAVNKDYRNRTANEWERTTNFFDVSYWGDSAKKNLPEYTKGREVLVEAELKTSSWEKDGKKYSRTEIRASRVRPLRRPGEGKRTNNEQLQNSYSQAPSYTSAPPQAPDFDDMPPDNMADEGDPEGIPF